jgi:hypothetical protein
VKGVSIEIKFMKKFLKMFSEDLFKLLFRKRTLLQAKASLMFLEEKKKFSTDCFYNASSKIID